MVTQPAPVSLSSSKAIAVQSTPALAQALPAISVGDVVRFSVRQNRGNGSGLIFVNGQLLQANMPENLKDGSRLLARVSTLDSAVIFKVLDVQQSFKAVPGGPTTSIAQQLSTLIKSGSPAGLRGPAPFQLPTDLAKLGLSQNQLQVLFNSIGDPAQLINSQGALAFLLSAANGDLAGGLQQSAAALRDFANNNSPSFVDRLLVALRPELGRLIELSRQDTLAAASNLTLIVKNLSNAIKDAGGKASESQQQLLSNTMADLQKAQQNPAQLRSLLESLHEKLSQTGLFTTTESGSNTAQNFTALGQAALRLEQMANTQEILNQLNPLMQAMGEPALILFPFLFQGLVSHSEVTIDSNAHKKKQQDGSSDSEEEQSEGQGETYQRVQVNVPLPSLGNISVDVAHKDQEILVRFTAEDPEKASFLLEQMEHLSGIFRGQGFESAELVAGVGRKTDALPDWSQNLRVDTSVLV